MFTIVISEKGGAERRETFEKNEINVGRVQGNDLMLPKGNVSKHHARLLYRDGRFIVTDLKSTNGTYVNGRKISQATIVREGDKIYIGDFVLRLETGQKAALYAEDDARGSVPSAPGHDGPASRDGALPAATLPPGRPPLPPPIAPPMVLAAGASGGAVAPVMASASPSSPRLSEPGVSHYPLERDPDDSESSPGLRGASLSKVPSAPRVPHSTDPRGRGNTMLLGGERAAPHRTASSAPVQVRPPRSVPPAPARPASRETQQQAAHRLALITLVDRVADTVDLAPLQKSPVVSEDVAQSMERAVRQQARAMRDDGEAPDGIDLELLAREALRELVGLGPIGPLLDDDETTEVHVVRPDYVLASKHGQCSLAEPCFTSEDAIARVVARLAHQSGDPLREGELVIDRRLPRGAYMIAIAPPAAGGWVLHLRKRRRVEGSLADLVRAGAISEAIATFLEASALARANVLVVGSNPGAILSMLGAIASAGPPGERVAVLHQGADELALPHAHVVPLALVDHGPRGAQSVYTAARLGMDRLVVTSLGGGVATATIDVIAEGSEGVMAGIGGPSLRHALARLVSHVALAHPGSSVEAAREAVGQSFDVAVEVQQTDGGRLRTVRVAELDGSDALGVTARDLFLLSANGDGETAYIATGVSPRLALDFGARGVKLDGPSSRPSRPSSK
jgi:pilus assembly protein CpaF